MPRHSLIAQAVRMQTQFLLILFKSVNTFIMLTIHLISIDLDISFTASIQYVVKHHVIFSLLA